LSVRVRRRRAQLDEVKSVMRDVFDRSRYGTGSDVSELVQKILAERLREPHASPAAAAAAAEDRVVYATPDRLSILDNAAPLPLSAAAVREIPEAGDETEFVERTLAPSGRPWTSSPPPGARQVLVVRVADDDDGGGDRYFLENGECFVLFNNN